MGPHSLGVARPCCRFTTAALWRPLGRPGAKPRLACWVSAVLFLSWLHLLADAEPPGAAKETVPSYAKGGPPAIDFGAYRKQFVLTGLDAMKHVRSGVLEFGVEVERLMLSRGTLVKDIHGMLVAPYDRSLGLSCSERSPWSPRGSGTTHNAIAARILCNRLGRRCSGFSCGEATCAVCHGFVAVPRTKKVLYKKNADQLEYEGVIVQTRDQVRRFVAEAHAARASLDKVLQSLAVENHVRRVQGLGLENEEASSDVEALGAVADHESRLRIAEARLEAFRRMTLESLGDGEPVGPEAAERLEQVEDPKHASDKEAVALAEAFADRTHDAITELFRSDATAQRATTSTTTVALPVPGVDIIAGQDDDVENAMVMELDKYQNMLLHDSSILWESLDQSKDELIKQMAKLLACRNGLPVRVPFRLPYIEVPQRRCLETELVYPSVMPALTECDDDAMDCAAVTCRDPCRDSAAQCCGLCRKVTGESSQVYAYYRKSTDQLLYDSFYSGSFMAQKRISLARQESTIRIMQISVAMGTSAAGDQPRESGDSPSTSIKEWAKYVNSEVNAEMKKSQPWLDSQLKLHRYMLDEIQRQNADLGFSHCK